MVPTGGGGVSYSNSIDSSVDKFASLRMPQSKGSLMVFPR